MNAQQIRNQMVNVNSSGQGFHPDHDKNPFHADIMGTGLFTYTHSVAICRGDEETFTVYHCYRTHEDTNKSWSIGIMDNKGFENSWVYDISRSRNFKLWRRGKLYCGGYFDDENHIEMIMDEFRDQLKTCRKYAMRAIREG
tara:strand:+ start:26 stop:448 length:423 start_codon:yes stop_codon:yes gene_type:complete